MEIKERWCRLAVLRTNRDS